MGLMAAAVLTAAVLIVIWFRPGTDASVSAEPSAEPSPTPVAESPTTATGPSESTPEQQEPGPSTEPSKSEPEVTGSKAEALDPKKVRAAAKSAMTNYLEIFDAALQGEEIDGKALATVSMGSAKGELEAAVADYSEQKFRQVGDVKVLDIKFPKMSLKGAEPSVVVNVCIDSHQVDVVDELGDSLSAFLFRPGEPIFQTYEMAFSKSAWRVSEHQISDEVVGC